MPNGRVLTQSQWTQTAQKRQDVHKSRQDLVRGLDPLVRSRLALCVSPALILGPQRGFLGFHPYRGTVFNRLRCRLTTMATKRGEATPTP